MLKESTISREFLQLRGGPIVNLAAIRLACALEDRGLSLTADGTKLRVSSADGSPPALSAEEKTAIARLKAHLLVIATYEPPEVS